MKHIFEQHYEAPLPANKIEESEQMAEATEARIEKMKMNALLQGYVLSFGPQELEKYYFKELDLPKHPKAPKIKFSLIQEANRLIKEFRRSQRKDSPKPTNGS